MFTKHPEQEFLFISRPFWLEMNAPLRLVREKYRSYFGDSDVVIEDRTDAISRLTLIVDKLQMQMVDRLKTENPNSVVKDLYKILDESFHFYIKQKKARAKLIELGINSGDIGETFERNRDMVRNVIDAVNLWLENCLLYQDSIDKPYNSETFDVDYNLFIDLYIYGLASKALSLLTLSKKLGDKSLFYGIRITPNDEEPMEVLRYHPVVYFNTLLTGNQNVFQMSREDYQQAGNSEFGIGFKCEHGIDFLLALRTMSTLQEKMLNAGKIAYTVIDKEDFINWINTYTGKIVDGNLFFEAFALTKEKILSQVRGDDPIIWIMSTNRFRHEIRPIICLSDDRIAISYTALEQAKQLWLSFFGNGGMIYSNYEDQITTAIEKRNKELSKKLVIILREKLREHYAAGFDEIDVRYNRIFGSKPYDYGDYDLVFYAKDSNELFLIEAKFFSDSYNNSGIITDYEKLFKKKGYYDHCRKRYDLVLEEAEKVKEFIHVKGSIKVHFLFVSSKPLEIEFTDADGIVCFPCLSIFDNYLDAKLLPEVGDTPVRPTHTI